jgi:hypothetical protein
VYIKSYRDVKPESTPKTTKPDPATKASFVNSPSSMALITKYKAAVVQAEPGWFDLELSTQKTIDLINEAGSKGCKLIAFPELCTTAHPIMLS